MNIHLCTNVIKKYFYLLYPTQSLNIVIIHMSDYQGAKTFAVATFVAAAAVVVVVVEKIIRHFTQSTSVTYG